MPWSSASAPARRPTARCSSSTTCSGSARGSARGSSSATRTSRTRWTRAWPRSRPTCARAATPRPSTTTRSSPRSWSGSRPRARADGPPGRALHSAARMARLGHIFSSRDREFFDLFEEAARNVTRGADLLDQMLAHFPDRADLARDIVICEQEGDRIAHDTPHKLNSTFVTPIDREDILELTSDLDDIIDLIDEVADYLGADKIEAPMEQSQRMAHILRPAPTGRVGRMQFWPMQATRQIEEAMRRLRSFQDLSPFRTADRRLRWRGD